MRGDRYSREDRIREEIERLRLERELLREERLRDNELERFLDETEGEPPPSLIERIMEIRDDPRHPMSPKSFEDAFRQMGFEPRRRR